MIYPVLAATGYAFLPIFTKNLLASGMDPIDLVAWRYLIAVPIFWGIALARPVAPLARPIPRRRVLVLGTLLALAGITAFVGLQFLNAGTYVVLFYTYPTMVALIGLFMGERLSLTGYSALALTGVGIILSAPDFSSGFSGEALPGVILALLNALIVAIYFLWSGRMLRGTSSLRGGAWTVTGTLVFMLAVAPFGGVTVPSTPSAWLNLVLLATVSTVLPVFALNAGIQRLGAARASIVSTFEPLMTATLAMIFLGEQMAAVQWIGGLCIVASVIVLQLRRQPAPDAEIIPA